MDKPIYLGFAIKKLSSLLMYETYYDKLQPYFGEKTIQLHYLDTDTFVLNKSTSVIIKDLQKLEDFFDIFNLNESYELYGDKNEKFFGELKKTPLNVLIDDIIRSGSKAYLLKCGSDNRNELKGFSKSQSKDFKFEEIYNCLFGAEYQKECDKYIIQSINRET